MAIYSIGSKVLIISTDNVRYDCVSYTESKSHLKSLYLDSLVDTPTIDELSKNSSIFTNCFSTSSYTTSAHASLFTGAFQPKHGIRPFFYKKLKDDCITLSSVYKHNGYKTILYTDVIELFQPLGLTKGFDQVYSNDINELFKYLETVNSDEKIFCFMHLFDAHEPYIYSQNINDYNYNKEYYEFINKMSFSYKFPIMMNNDPFSLWSAFSSKVSFNEQILLPAYIQGINKFDKNRFRLIVNNLKKLGYFNDENIYAILSDHGEGRISFFDPTVFGHMGELFDEVIHIPLMIHSPKLDTKVYDRLVSLVDIFPTILNLSDIEYDNSDLDSVDIFSKEEREYCYSEFCTQNMYNEITQFSEPVYDRSKNAASSKDKYFLSQRSIKTKNKKYIFIPENISESEGRRIIENVNLSNKDFIIELFNSVMRKRISKPEYLHLLNVLETKQGSRNDIYQSMINSGVYNRSKNFYFDLISDPFETNIIDLDISSSDAIKYIEVLNSLELKSHISENIFTDKESDIEIIEPNFNTECYKSDFLKQKISLSIEVIKEAYAKFDNKIGIAFTGGKDSLVLLDLIRTVFNGEIPFKIITIDTTAEFTEIKKFIDSIKVSWDIDILTYSNKEAIKSNYSIAKDKIDCCNTLKTIPLKQAIKDLHLKALFTGIRKDETEARSNEVYFSKRKDPYHFRIHPILHFTESDIWTYIKINNLPYCTLYSQGYRSIDCAPCTEKSNRDQSERSGRSKEKEVSMDKLRQLGYF